MKTMWSIIGIVCLSLCTFSCRYSHMRWESSDGEKLKDVTLGAEEVHEGWYFAAGNRVVIDGTINGDAYIAGGTVVVNGKINGDLIAAGGRVEMNGTVTDNIRSAGGNVFVNGSVGRDVTTAGGQVEIGRAAAIAGNLLCAGGQIDVNGAVGRNAKIASGDLRIGGTIAGDVDFAGGKLNAPHAGAIGGNLHAHVQKDQNNVSIADSAVHGNVQVDIDMSDSEYHVRDFPTFWFRLYWFLALLFTGTILLLIAPAPFASIGAMIMNKPGQSILWSFAWIFAVPIAGVILCITLLGIPVAMVLGFLYFLILFLSQMTLGIALGRRLMGMEGKRGFHLFLTFVVGLAIIFLLEAIPIVRPLLMIVGALVGTGAIILVCADVVKKVRA